MDKDDLQFKGDNPGSVRHGNFINYYNFNDVNERLKLLPENIWNLNNTENTIVCLDIGCNAGNLTEKLQQFVAKYSGKQCYILGIDIDPILIKRANENYNSKYVKFAHLDFMDNNLRENIFDNYLNSVKCDKFNAIFCFSITMWIHLNHGDIGLNTFLSAICELSSNLVIVEPQSWKSYKTAVKRLKLSNNDFPLYNSLQIRNNVEIAIDNKLKEHCKKMLETDQTKWNRKLLIYYK